MALFNWFTKKSDSTAATRPCEAVQKASRSHGALPSALTPSTASTPSADPSTRSEERKAKRHIRREQLYSAIRQAMTRSGVLSASFKFKVLSLDQCGDQFLVMMDVHPSLGLQEEKLLQSEALVVQIAKAQFDMLVTAVYWRINTQAGLDEAIPAREPSEPAAVAVSIGAATATSSTPMTRKPVAARFEPIGDDEMTAFRRALAASAAHTNLPESGSAKTFAVTATALTAFTAVTAATPESLAKSRTGLHSYTLLTGFEDTEMPELADLPALSTTQYGDLN